jgi:hypothetical protein
MNEQFAEVVGKLSVINFDSDKHIRVTIIATIGNSYVNPFCTSYDRWKCLSYV